MTRPRDLPAEVERALLERGWEEENPREFVLRSGRTTYRASAVDALAYARTHGLDALERFLDWRGETLEREAERNRFLERRVRGDLERDFAENPLGRTRTKPRGSR